MPARIRKLIGLVAIMVFLVAYVAAAATVGEHVPDHWLARLVYYALAGTLWGLPLFPLIRWMNTEP
jgi:hypothetical protein